MKILLVLALLAGCASTSVEFTDRNGQTVSMPVEMYAVKMQQEYADKVVSKTCDKINEPMLIPENIRVDNDGAWAIAMMAVAHGQAKEDCADAMADIARTNKPTDYLQYKLADKRATIDGVLKAGGLLTGVACMFRILGACDYNNGSGGGNSYGDNWVFNQSNAAPGTIGGGGGEGGTAAGGEGGGLAGAFRPSNNINFGHGNVMGSDLNSSLAGMNESLTFVNGSGSLDSSTDNSDNRSLDGEGGLQNQF
jgi:hypothetical protein